MRTFLLRGRRYSVISRPILLGGIFFISFFGAIGYLSLDEPARADSLIAPVVIAPQDNAVVKGSYFTQTWESVVGATKYEYQSYYDALGAQLKYKELFKAPMKPNANAADGTFIWWRVRAVDNVGAVGPWSPLSKLTIDNTAPSTSLQTSTPQATPNLYNGPITITGTVAAAEKNLASHTFTVTNPQGVVSTVGPVSATGLSHSFTLDTSAGDGAYTISYSATDKANNKSAAIAPVTVVVDKTTPAAPSLALTGANTVSPTNTSAISAGWNKPSDDTEKYILSYYNNIPGSEWKANNLKRIETTSPDWAGALTDGDGEYTLHVQAVDRVGNVSPVSNTVVVTLDQTKPGAPTLSVAGLASGALSNNPAVSASWNQPSTDTTRYEYQYYSATGTVWSQAAPLSLATTNVAWSGSLEGGDDQYFLSVRAFDAAGNASDWSAPVTLTLDTLASEITIAPVAQPITAPASVAITATTDDDTVATATFTVNGGTPVTVNVVDGVFALPVQVFVAGSHTVTVAVVDAAGNPSTATYSFVVTAPVVVTPVDTGEPANNGGGTGNGNGSAAQGGTQNAAAPASAVASDENGQIFDESDDPTVRANGLAVDGGDTNAAQEIRGTTDTRAGVSGIGASVWGWLIAAVVIIAGWWFVAAVRRRRKDEE